MISKQLVNEYGSTYGWEVFIPRGLSSSEEYDLVFDHMSLDPDSDEDNAYYFQGGNGVWDQLRIIRSDS